MKETAHFALLGTVEVRRGGRTTSAGRPLQQGVLAYLLMHANQVISVDRLTEAIWGGSPPNTARSQIHIAMSGLRQVLPDGSLMTRDGGYQVTVRDEGVDLFVFQCRLREAKRAEPARAAELLREALALWRGEPCTGVPARFVDSLRYQVSEQRLAAYTQLADVELALGHQELVIAELTELLVNHRLHEGLTERLMLALYRTGRRSDALHVGRTLRRLLAEQQGLDPGQSFVDLEKAILNAEPSLTRTAVPVAEPLVVTPIVPAQLPGDNGHFSGRRDLLRQLDDNLRQHKLGVVSGLGGVGKSVLAVRWAHNAVERYPDGQLYVNLHGHSTTPPVPPQAALARMLRALGVEADHIPFDVDEAAALYRTMMAPRRMLVILDDADSAEQVRPLLPNSASTVLVTSRDSLHGLQVRDGAVSLTLDMFSQAESRDLFGRVLGAQRSYAEEGTLNEIADFCGHLPLALRICATVLASQPGLSAASYLDELRRNDLLAVLAVHGDSASCVATVFDRSLHRLSEQEGRLFRLLSLVPGPEFTASAAAALLDESPAVAQRVLDRFTSANLIQRLAPGRFTIHSLLRRYAGEQVPASEHLAALRRLESERPNLLALRLPLQPTPHSRSRQRSIAD